MIATPSKQLFLSVLHPFQFQQRPEWSATNENQLLFEAKDIIDPVFSHDGRRILFNWYRDGESFIYSVDATTGGDPILLPLFPAASTAT